MGEPGRLILMALALSTASGVWIQAANRPSRPAKLRLERRAGAPGANAPFTSRAFAGATGAGAFAVIRSSSPPQYCRGSMDNTFDTVGSFCEDRSVPRFQWIVNGASVPGATQDTYVLPAVQGAGRYDVSMEMTCDDGSSAQASPVTVDIVGPPAPVGDSLAIEGGVGGADLHLTWDPVAGAEGYEVWQDRLPDGPFTLLSGEAPFDSPELYLTPLPGDLFFLTGAFSQCGRSALKVGISHIDNFLEQCPTVDPVFSKIVNDFHVRRDGVLVTDFSGCTYPVSQVPLQQWTDELIILQTLRTIYYMDLGKQNYLPWTSLRLYDWLLSKVQGFDIISGAGGGGACCETFPDGTYIAQGEQNDVSRDGDRIFEGIQGNIQFYGHEARHVDGFPHTGCCPLGAGACDQTYDETNLSAYAVQYWLRRAFDYGDIDVGVGCLSTLRQFQILEWIATGNYEKRFCTNAPPHLIAPAPGSLPCP